MLSTLCRGLILLGTTAALLSVYGGASPAVATSALTRSDLFPALQFGPSSWTAWIPPTLSTEYATEIEQVDVALDPGHSSWDVGASGAGLREFEVTLDVAQRTRAWLESQGLRVRLTREDNRRVAASVPSDLTEAVRTEQFARLAVATPATVFVSIHFNGHPDRSQHGTETYFNSDNQGDESRRLATSIHASTLQALADAGYVSLDRGVREDLTAGKPYGHFFSLRGPFPSALIESLFLSNEQESAMLYQSAIRDAIAEGVGRGIQSYLASGSSER
jgi:N-acetylmuramoyl-L-alanine amidase